VVGFGAVDESVASVRVLQDHAVDVALYSQSDRRKRALRSAASCFKVSTELEQLGERKRMAEALLSEEGGASAAHPRHRKPVGARY
jgi:hypothetical protein